MTGAVSVLAPESVTAPEPFLMMPPAPVIGPLNVMSKFPPIIADVESAIGLLRTRAAVSAWRVPPLNVSVPEPSAALSPTEIVPDVRLMPPLKVFAAPSRSVPCPVFTTLLSEPVSASKPWISRSIPLGVDPRATLNVCV